MTSEEETKHPSWMVTAYIQPCRKNPPKNILRLIIVINLSHKTWNIKLFVYYLDLELYTLNHSGPVSNIMFMVHSFGFRSKKFHERLKNVKKTFCKLRVRTILYLVAIYFLSVKAYYRVANPNQYWQATTREFTNKLGSVNKQDNKL